MTEGDAEINDHKQDYDPCQTAKKDLPWPDAGFLFLVSSIGQTAVSADAVWAIYSACLAVSESPAAIDRAAVIVAAVCAGAIAVIAAVGAAPGTIPAAALPKHISGVLMVLGISRLFLILCKARLLSVSGLLSIARLPGILSRIIRLAALIKITCGASAA